MERQHAQPGDHLAARLGRVDDVVDEAALGCRVRVGVLLGVLGHQLGTAGGRIRCLLQLTPVHDLDRALGAHDRQLGRRPGERQVGPDRLRVHHDVGAAVRLARDDRDPRHRRLAVGVQQLGAVADDAAVLLVDARQEARNVDEGQQRDVERVARADESGRLLGRLDVEHAGEDHRLVADHTDGLAVDPCEPAQDRLRPVREVLEELAVVDDRLDDGVHVVRQVRTVGKDVDQLRTQPLRVVRGLLDRRLLQVVRREERQQVAHVVQARLLVVGDERGHTGLRRVRHGTTEFLERHLLTRDRLHDVGAGDEHVRRLAHHEDEVGHRRRVHGATGARAQDHRDLGDDAGRLDVASEDAAVAREADDTLLDACARAVVQTDERSAGLERQVHQLVDLLREHLTEGATEDGEVLGEDEHLAPVDRAPAGDHTVGVRPLVEAGLVRTMPRQHVELVEAPLVEEVVDALAGEHLALRVLTLDRALRAGGERGLAALVEIIDLVLHRTHGTERSG